MKASPGSQGALAPPKTNILAADIHHHAAGEPAPACRRGDFIVISGTSWISRLILLFCRRSHASFIQDHLGAMVESLWRGPVETHISDYDDREYVLISPQLTDREREKAVAYARGCLGWRYSYLTLLVGVPLAYLSGYRLILTGAESAICSALVAHAQRSTGQWFAKPAGIMTPDDLEDAYRGPGSPSLEVSPGSSGPRAALKL